MKLPINCRTRIRRTLSHRRQVSRACACTKHESGLHASILAKTYLHSSGKSGSSLEFRLPEQNPVPSSTGPLNLIYSILRATYARSYVLHLHLSIALWTLRCTPGLFVYNALWLKLAWFDRLLLRSESSLRHLLHDDDPCHTKKARKRLICPV